MTDPWKERVRQAMAERKDAQGRPSPMTPNDLALALGVAPSLVWKLLKPIVNGGQVSSALVPRISEILGVGSPTEPARIENIRRAKLENLIDKMDDEQLDGAIFFLERLLRK